MSFTEASSSFLSTLFRQVREELLVKLGREPTAAEVREALEIENSRYGEGDMPCKKP